MSPATRIGAFAALLAVVFAAAALAGDRLNPGVAESDGEHAEEDETMAATTMTTETDGEHGASATAASLPGLAVAQDGLRLEPEHTRLDSEADATYRFRIVDSDGEVVRDFDVEHERRMHLILVRRDFTAFQHLHPRQLADGAWEARADLAAPGVHRVFADFSSGGESRTLAADLFVPGRFDPRPLPAPEPRADAGDGYEVTLDSPAPRAGSTSPARFTVSRNGREVASVEPYLGADGHLVALREHDQAFLHTHPEGEPGGPGPISFDVEYPTAGRYRLFLQFRHGGEVRTAAFTQVADGNGGGAEEAGHAG